jgi:hypothetical protein
MSTLRDWFETRLGAIALCVLFVAGVFGFLWFDLWMTKRSIRRSMEETRRKLQQGTYVPPHFERTLVVDGDGFSIASDKSGVASVRIAWSEVETVFAFKRDLFAIDRICLGFGLTHPPVVEVDEEMNGWPEFIDALPRFLPSCDPPSEWLGIVTVPAFATNQTQIYIRAGEEPARSKA